MTRSVILMMVAMGMFTTIPAFAVNRVLSLDGDGDYVEIEASESLNAIKSGVTMEAWIKVAEFKGNWMPIVYKGDKRTEDRSNRTSCSIGTENRFKHSEAAKNPHQCWIL